MKETTRIVVLAVVIAVLMITPQGAQASRSAGLRTGANPADPTLFASGTAPVLDSTSAGSTIYVDGSNHSALEDGTNEHPFDTILEGSEIADSNDTVQVAAGTYRERIALKDGVQLLHSDYLPLVFRPRPGIHGRVTFGGAAVEGVQLELRFYDGSSWSTAANTSTDAQGYYAFLSAPSLGPGQGYYVRYRNTAGTPQRLWIWGTRTLTSYVAGSSAHAGSFDIANINLVAPADRATVSLPYTFQWTPRPATLSDSYEFNLFDLADDSPYFYTDPPLGYVGSYTLNALPQGFGVGRQYVWDMWVYGADGGFGVSFYVYRVTFSNAGLSTAVTAVPRSEKPAQYNKDLPSR